jgi:hypothetical protein
MAVQVRNDISILEGERRSIQLGRGPGKRYAVTPESDLRAAPVAGSGESHGVSEATA